MKDVHLAELARQQFNRFSRSQIAALGFSEQAVRHRLRTGRLVEVEPGVLAIAPVLEHDDWGRWWGATLTHATSLLSRRSAAAAKGFWSLERKFETVTRPGCGGPRRHGNVIVYRSLTLAGDFTDLDGMPITTVPRTLLDLATEVSDRALARSVREAVRLKMTTPSEIWETLAAHRGERGTRRLARTLARYAGLPIERARSGAEVRALELLRAAHRPDPRLNVRIAGEEADLSWSDERLIIEIDGGPYHLDKGEDWRKQRAWEQAGWLVCRVDADDIYERPERLLELAPR